MVPGVQLSGCRLGGRLDRRSRKRCRHHDKRRDRHSGAPPEPRWLANPIAGGRRMTTFVNTLFVQAMVNALVDSFDADSSPGYVEIRNGAQPAAGPDAVRTGVLLATIPLAKPAFGSATDPDPGPSAALSGVTDDQNGKPARRDRGGQYV